MAELPRKVNPQVQASNGVSFCSSLRNRSTLVRDFPVHPARISRSTPSGMSLVTTLPAPITVLEPIFTPGGPMILARQHPLLSSGPRGEDPSGVHR